MLNVEEYNSSLYKSIEKRNKRKHIIQNYGTFLSHAANTPAEPNIEQQARSWLKNFNSKMNSVNGDEAKSMVRQCAVLIRKLNAKNSSPELIDKLRKARTHLENVRTGNVEHSDNSKSLKFDISGEEMNNYLMHGSIKHVETTETSEESGELKKKELMHYGVPKQKHGVRRYQNEDGSLTPDGRIHYGVGEGRDKSGRFPYNSGDNPYTTPASEPGERTIDGYYREQNRLKAINAEQFSDEMFKIKQLPEPKTENPPYWDYPQGSKEYKKAYEKAIKDEKVFFRISDYYNAALERWGMDSPITQAAKKKYGQALVRFEDLHGYTPQEFD